MTRAGIVTLCGKPNAGKSTLLNFLVGQKLSIVSSKPQSTRERTVGILTNADSQIVLLDTPGLMDPQYALQRAMRHTAVRALEDADLIVYLVDAHDTNPLPLVQAAALTSTPRAPVLTVFNKIDTLENDARASLEHSHPQALLVSALTGDGIAALLDRARAALPESPFLYPDDEVGSQSLRFFAAEFIRETALEQLEEEVPYSIACAIEEFREDRRPVYIRAVIYVERESQKRIVIGQRGTKIREIGRASREKIEAMIDAPVYLDLWVKVLPNWRRDANALRRLGFTHTDEESRP
jgi:GTP-binding protein Era